MRGPPGEHSTVVSALLGLLDELANRFVRLKTIVLAQVFVSVGVFEQDVDPVTATVVVARVAVDQSDEPFTTVAKRPGEFVEGERVSFTRHCGAHLALFSLIRTGIQQINVTAVHDGEFETGDGSCDVGSYSPATRYPI